MINGVRKDQIENIVHNRTKKNMLKTRPTGRDEMTKRRRNFWDDVKRESDVLLSLSRGMTIEINSSLPSFVDGSKPDNKLS